MEKQKKFRLETDILGSKEIPEDALYGIHSLRASENFPISKRKINPALIKAYGYVKLACATANFECGYLSEEKFSAIQIACQQLIEGALSEHIIVDALQGGAGTSTNMNINEVIANFAIIQLGGKLGDYSIIHPLDDVNLHQSTNDTYPTALRVAAIYELKELETNLVNLLESLQQKEKEFEHIIKIGRTELMDAVPTTLGRTFSAFAEAISRDRWRLYKCQERLKSVNLGGTAIGTGIGAPRKYIFKAIEKLRKLTKLPLARADNLIEATQNLDDIAEVSGILKTLAVNLIKISNDLRIMASGPETAFGEITLPPLQAGSSIMPGKINPVIPEAVIQTAILVSANDSAICNACSAGNLELNHLLPLIADKFLENIQLLSNSTKILADKCIKGICANTEKCISSFLTSTAAVTALLQKIPYSTLCKIHQEMKTSGKNLKDIVLEQKLLSEEEFNTLISAEELTKLGSN